MNSGLRPSQQRRLHELVYALCIFVACVAMQTAEIDALCWQYWTVVGCVFAARMAGYALGSIVKE